MQGWSLARIPTERMPERLWHSLIPDYEIRWVLEALTNRLHFSSLICMWKCASEIHYLLCEKVKCMPDSREVNNPWFSFRYILYYPHTPHRPSSRYIIVIILQSVSDFVYYIASQERFLNFQTHYWVSYLPCKPFAFGMCNHGNCSYKPELTVLHYK